VFLSNTALSYMTMRASPIWATLVLASCIMPPRQSWSEPPSGSSAPVKGGPGVTALCAADAAHVDGPYKYENNQWGKKKAKGKFEQCLLKRTVEGKTEVGWTWNWPGLDPTVFAYPEIIFGWKPWSGGKPSDPRFPLKVADIQHLAMHYAVETEASGTYNLAPEIWLTRSGQWSHEPNAGLITAEIMFWMDYKDGARPAGSVIDEPTIDGIKYEFWKADNIGDMGNGKGWVLYSFKSPTIQHEGSISIHTLLSYMMKKQLVRPDEYVASVEFGNEVMGGTGTTWVKRFQVEVRP
jgi:hypothetical protein